MPRPGRSPCLQCRYRKVRCDRRQDTCGSCERLQFACSFKQPDEQQKGQKNAAAPPERRRASRACLACKRLKARCSGELPECNNCRRRQKRCRYSSSGPPETVQPLESLNEPTEIDGWLGPLFPIRRQEMLNAIDRFFRHLYPILSFSFLHEPSIRQHCAAGTLDPSLALVLAAVTNVYLSPDQSLLQECKSWVRRVETEIWEHLHEPSIIRVQTLVLIVLYHIQTGEFSRAYMLAGMAARSATALRLNYERPELGFVAQETRRRVLWALTSVDGIFSVGLPEYETMPYAIVYQRLPCSEEEYSGLREPQHPNLLAACFQVSKIQRDVMRLTRQLAISDKPLVELPGLVQEIQNDLWRLHSDLELTADFSISATTQPLNMKESRWFARYLMASLSWHQVHCDLYRIFLPGYAEAVPTVIMDATDVNFRHQAAEMCRIHVQLIFKILGGVLKADVPLLPLYVAVCTYQAARLTLFLPSLRSEITTESAIASATTALGILYKFFSATPWAQDIIADLERLVQCAPGVGNSQSVHSDSVHDSARLRHGQLAVHSLIRQANFVDGGYEG
ncbi:hypothetical protein ASPVEDRAFT_155152 [Aspergillus versicolor CBS 583.65]|uniref:Zn(2)-C6 fungal-type domain-containing protein n=1 Tax=Aspergillus versicolor CBS 583.65 TaxID=1036611 RepID=A0A1L9Q0I8_ASPVE|nr:uncharacterized protein ASPVEDRAFT_155152 [Aspergillus versicolor CBS 583.65]OJJ07273.1 hypothetical protein ASPVEDRAFT_155152 [Aspergillus versicolor CBS 583.65]